MANKKEGAAPETKTTVPAETNPWNVKKKIIIEKRYKKDRYRTVIVNGHKYAIKTGVEVEVPLPIYENIRTSNRQRNDFEDMMNEFEDNSSY